VGYTTSLDIEYATLGAASHTVTYVHSDFPDVPTPVTDGHIPIGADEAGLIAVSVAADDLPAAGARFFINVTPLEQWLGELPSNSHHKDNTETFVADNVEWRVLTKTMGTGGGTGGNDILIVSEYIYRTPVAWHEPGYVSGGFLGSTMYTATLPALYDELTWAHDYAVLPDTSGSGWHGPLSWGNTYGDSNNITKSTGTPVPPDGVGGLFLLSYKDSYEHSALWGGTGDHDDSDDSAINMIRAVFKLCTLGERLGGVSAGQYWTRNTTDNTQDLARAYRFPRDNRIKTGTSGYVYLPGCVGDSRDNTTASYTDPTVGIRPAMRLRLSGG
jgi:hypothetical protein